MIRFVASTRLARPGQHVWRANTDLRLYLYAADQKLTMTRGMADEYFFLLDFGGMAGWQGLADLGLADGVYRELLTSTWPAFQDEHANGGRNARLERSGTLHVPDYGAVVLERV